MDMFDIHEAKTRLSRLVEKAARNEVFPIAKAGKPMIEAVPTDAPAEKRESRVDFLRGVYISPADMRSSGREEIEKICDDVEG